MIAEGEGSPEPEYTVVADEQLDALEAKGPAALFNAVLDACEAISANPGLAQSRSSAITTADGIVFRTAVAGAGDLKVFWSTNPTRIEAVFPHL